MTERNVPVRWFLIDDGWFGAREKMLADLRPDHEKFPEGFKRMTDEIRANSSIKWFGVWHALGGYWDGIAPGSPAELYYQNGFPLAKAAREIAFSLESGACIMNGAMINCMEMGMETVLSM